MTEEKTAGALDKLTTDLTRLTAVRVNPAANDHERAAEHDRLITALLDNQWMAACRDAAKRDHPFLDNPENDSPTTPRTLAFALFAEEGEEHAARARAILMAACAARAYLHGGGRDAARWRDEARRWWIDSAPETDATETLTGDLVDWFCGTSPIPVRSIRVPVLLHEGSPDELGIGELILEEVKDGLGRIMPDPATMAFTRPQRVIDAGLGTAFAWARGREDAPRGAGVRWRLLTEARTPALDAPGLQAGAAAAVGFAWMWRRSLVPSRWRRTAWPHDGSLVHAGLDSSGRLLPSPDLHQVAAGVIGRGIGLVVADQEADRVRAAAGPAGRQVTAVSNARAALGRVRDAGGRRRRIAWTLTAAALAAAIAAAATVTGLVLSDSNAGQRASAEVLRLALGSSDEQADEPDQALADALAARALDPQNATARGALLSSVTADLRTERVLTTGVTDPRMIALSGDGRWVAVVGRGGTPHIRDTRTGATVSPPDRIGQTTTLAFAHAANGPLALVGDRRVLLWSPGAHAPARLVPVLGRQPVSLAFSRDDHRLAAGCADGSVLLWDLSNPDAAPRATRPQRSAVRAVAFTPSGDAVISTGDDRTVRSWQWQRGNAGHVWRGLDSPGRYIAVRASGSAVYVLTRGKVHFLTPDLRHRLRAPVAVPANGQILYRQTKQVVSHIRTDTLLLAVSNGVVEVSAESHNFTQDDGTSLQAVNTTYARSSLTGSIAALSGDDTLVAVPTPTGAVRLYRQQAGQVHYNRLPWIRAIHPIPGTRRQLVVVGVPGNTNTVVLIDPDTERPVAFTPIGKINYRTSAYLASAHTLLVGTTGGLYTVAVNGDHLGQPKPVTNLSPAGAYTVIDDEARHRLIVGWGDRVTIQDSMRGLSTSPRTIPIPPGETSLAVSPDGERLFTATGNGLYSLRLEDASPWARRVTLTRRQLARVIAFPNNVVVAASADGQVLRYQLDVDQSWSESPLPGHTGALEQLVAYQGKAISIGTEGNLRVSDAATGTLLATVQMPTAFFGEFATLGTTSTVTGLRVFDALNETAVDIPLNDHAVRDKACAQFRTPTPLTVSDIWPKAPSSVRDRLLCPTT